MRLYLVDSSISVVAALREAFRTLSEVTVSHGDILCVAHNAVVSPANAFGFMDGGIDAAYRKFFGAAVEERVREAIGRRPEGYLPVGASLIVRTGHPAIPYLIVAATMLNPEMIDSDNSYRAMRAVLRAAAAQKGIGQAVFCPGLGTGVGGVAPEQAAEQMANAYSDWRATTV